MSRKRYTPEQIIHHFRPADVLLGRGTKVSELCKQPEVAIGFSVKKIPGTAYTKMGASSGVRVPPWSPRSDHPPRVDTVNPSERRSPPRLCFHRTFSGRQVSSRSPGDHCCWGLLVYVTAAPAPPEHSQPQTRQGLVIQGTVDTVVVVIQLPASDHSTGFLQA